MFKLIRKKLIEGLIKDIIKDLPKYKKNALIYFQSHKEEIIEKVIDFVKKEVLYTLVLLLVCVMPVLADEAKQEIKNDQAYFTANLQKQPEKDNTQKIGNHFSFFVVNIQINGKLKDIDTPEDVR